MLRRHLYRLLIIVFPIATQGQWTTDAWTGPNAFRWAPGAVTYPVASNLHAQVRQVTWIAETTNGIIPSWDGRIHLASEDEYVGASYAAIDFEIPAPATNETFWVDDVLTFTGIFTQIRFALADAPMALTTNWTASHSTMYSTNDVTWSVQEEFWHAETNLTIMTPDEARTHDIYEAIRERWLALGVGFDLGGPRSTRVISNATNYQTEISAAVKWHYGRAHQAASIPGITAPPAFALSLTNRSTREDWFGWLVTIEDNPGWYSIGELWPLGLQGLSSSEKVKLALKGLLTNYVDSAKFNEAGTLEDYFSALDSDNPSAWQWRSYPAQWSYPNPMTESQAFTHVWATTNEYWDLERYPEDIPMTTYESFFRAHTNIPHYFRPSIVTNHLLPWNTNDWLIKGWQVGITNLYWAPPDAVITNYTLEATWFDWSPDRASRWMSSTDYGTIATTTWTIASHEYRYEFYNPTLLIDSLGLASRALQIRQTIMTGTVQKVTSWIYAGTNLLSKTDYTAPTNVVITAISTNNVIAPGFTASDYGMDHATSVVAAMKYTLGGMGSNSFWQTVRAQDTTYTRTNQHGEVWVDVSPTTFSTNSGPTGSSYPPLYQRNFTVSDSLKKAETWEDKRYRYYNYSGGYTGSYSYSDGNLERNQYVSSIQASFFASPEATNTPATMQIYAIHPRRWEQERQYAIVLAFEPRKSQLSFKDWYAFQTQSVFYAEAEGTGARMVYADDIDGGEVLFSFPSAITNATEWMTPGLNVNVSLTFDPGEFWNWSSLERINEWRKIYTKPAAVIEWDFLYP